MKKILIRILEESFYTGNKSFYKFSDKVNSLVNAINKEERPYGTINWRRIELMFGDIHSIDEAEQLAVTYSQEYHKFKGLEKNIESQEAMAIEIIEHYEKLGLK